MGSANLDTGNIFGSFEVFTRTFRAMILSVMSRCGDLHDHLRSVPRLPLITKR